MQGLAGAGGREGQCQKRVSPIRSPRRERRVTDVNRTAHLVQVSLASGHVAESEVGVAVAPQGAEQPVRDGVGDWGLNRDRHGWGFAFGAGEQVGEAFERVRLCTRT